MQCLLLYSVSSKPVNPVSKSPSILDQWSTLSPAERRARIEEAKRAPYVDTPRGYETALVKPGKGE